MIIVMRIVDGHQGKPIERSHEFIVKQKKNRNLAVYCYITNTAAP